MPRSHIIPSCMVRMIMGKREVEGEAGRREVRTAFPRKQPGISQSGRGMFRAATRHQLGGRPPIAGARGVGKGEVQDMLSIQLASSSRW